MRAVLASFHIGALKGRVMAASTGQYGICRVGIVELGFLQIGVGEVRAP